MTVAYSDGEVGDADACHRGSGRIIALAGNDADLLATVELSLQRLELRHVIRGEMDGVSLRIDRPKACEFNRSGAVVCASEQVEVVIRGVRGPGVREGTVQEDVGAGGDHEIVGIGVVISGPAFAAKIVADCGDTGVADETFNRRLKGACAQVGGIPAVILATEVNGRLEAETIS